MILEHVVVPGQIAAGHANLDLGNVGAWDLKTAIDNFRKYAVGIGGVLIGLLGVCIMIVGLYHVFKKFTSTQPGGGESWGKIVAMVIVGGAMFAGGGWALYESIATGGKKTIEDAGNGFIMIDQLATHVASLSGLLG